jgi:hypothetical protein
MTALHRPPHPLPVAEPADAGADRYDTDFYSWALEQGRLIRAGDWAALDRGNLAEEIESLGREQFNELQGALRVLLVHILKWDHQPERRSRSWALSIARTRLDVEDILGDNPGLRPRIEEARARAYRKARLEAARQTGLDERGLPERCPYDLEEMMKRRFEP